MLRPYRLARQLLYRQFAQKMAMGFTGEPVVW
jgi:hypothetical protein